MPAIRQSRGSTSQLVSPLATRKKSKDKENRPPHSATASSTTKAFSLTRSRDLIDQDLDDEDVDEDEEEEEEEEEGEKEGEEDSFASRTKRSAVKSQKATSSSSSSRPSATGRNKSKTATTGTTNTRRRRTTKNESESEEEEDNEDDDDRSRASVSEIDVDEERRSRSRISKHHQEEDVEATPRAATNGRSKTTKVNARNVPSKSTATVSATRKTTASARGKRKAIAPPESESDAPSVVTDNDHDDQDLNETLHGRDELGTVMQDILTERNRFDEWIEKKLTKLTNKREKLLEEKLEKVAAEKEEVQSQLDELRQLRNTQAEKLLEEVKKTAETRHRHDKEMINSLKAKAEAAERRAREAEMHAGSSGDRTMGMVGHLRPNDGAATSSAAVDELEKQHKRQMAEALNVQKKLEEEVKQYKLQLDQEIAQSRALLEKATLGGPAAANHLSSSLSKPNAKQLEVSASLEQEKAIRKLYEDMTGLVITAIETIDAKKNFRKFKALFAQDGHHSLLLDLEESQSLVEPKTSGGTSGSSNKSTAKRQIREDLVYMPDLEEDRDRSLFESHVPDMWLTDLRFPRVGAFYWYNQLRKSLDYRPKSEDN